MKTFNFCKCKREITNTGKSAGKPTEKLAKTSNKIKEVIMATDKEMIDYIVEQIHDAGQISYKMMFGEYGIYSDKKIFALVCDNKLYIKPTKAGREFIGNVVESPPYPGAKNYFLIEDKLEDSDWLSELVVRSVRELPYPKSKKKMKK